MGNRFASWMVERAMPSYSIMHIALGGCLTAAPKYGITEDTGGHITYILGEARALAARDDVERCEIVTRLFDAPEYGTIHAQAEERLGPKCKITRIDSGNRAYLAKEALAADRAAFTRALIAELRSRRRRPDVIHAHFADAADVARQVKRELGIPFVYTPHSLARDKAAACGTACNALAARLEEEDRALAHAIATVTSSRDEAERQVLSYPGASAEKVWRIPPGIDKQEASEDDIASARALIAPFLRDPDKPIVFAVARPVKKKNLACLVRAFGQHGPLRRKANLVILPGLRHSLCSGEAEQRETMLELVDAIDAHNLHGIVAWPRQHDQSAVRGLYALAARSRGVFVNPALFEPFGLTILEAAVHGLPVVATMRGGPADIVEDVGHGVTVDPEDCIALGWAIDDVLSDTEEWDRFAANARERIADVSWEEYARQFTGMLGRVLQPPVRAEPAARPKLLLCDIDNTLTGCRQSAGALSDYLSRNPDIVFGVATGRSLIEARRIVNAWDYPEPAVWITSVGSEIYWRDGNLLRRDDTYSKAIAASWDGDSIGRLMQGRAGIDPQAEIEQRQFKRSYFSADPADAALAAELLAKAGLAGRVIYSHSRLLDILPERAGKAAAMRHVGTVLDVPMHRIFVAGDSGNDRDMVEACPNATVVANSEPELIEAGLGCGAFMATLPHAAGVLEGLLARLGPQPVGARI